MSKQSDQIAASDEELNKAFELINTKDRVINDLRREAEEKDKTIKHLTQLKQELAFYTTKLQEQKESLEIHHARGKSWLTHQ